MRRGDTHTGGKLETGGRRGKKCIHILSSETEGASGKTTQGDSEAEAPVYSHSGNTFLALVMAFVVTLKCIVAREVTMI